MGDPLKPRDIKSKGQRPRQIIDKREDEPENLRINPATSWRIVENTNQRSGEELMEWPWLYHTHHNRDIEDLPFWLSLAVQQGGPILELGCGTGRVALPLARAGYAVYGVDRDASMLAFLQASLLSSTCLSLIMIQADLTAFHLEKNFSLILLPCNTFTTLSSNERRAMLVCVKNHLTKGGLFVASLPNPSRLARLPLHSEIELEDVFQHPLSGEPVQVSSSWDHIDQYFTLSWHYDHLLPDGLVERLTVITRHDLSPLKVYLEEMKAVNLRIETKYGDYDRSRYHRNSPNLIILAKKC